MSDDTSLAAGALRYAAELEGRIAALEKERDRLWAACQEALGYAAGLSSQSRSPHALLASVATPRPDGRGVD